MLSVAQVYLTKNTEYHVFNGVCVALRNRNTGGWVAQHPTLGQRPTCMLGPSRTGIRKHLVSPRTGSALFFEEVGVTTGAVRQVRTATPEEIDCYTLLQATYRVCAPKSLPPAHEDQTGRVETLLTRPSVAAAIERTRGATQQVSRPRRG